MFIDDLAAFVTASPSSYHAAAEVARRLRTAGFTEQLEADPWQAEGARYVIRDGAIIAWRSAVTTGPVGFRIVGAHTDSPGFKLKPEPSAYAFGWSPWRSVIWGVGFLATMYIIFAALF